MGHLVGKDLYRKLGKKIDSQTMRAPWNKHLYHILTELYTPEEAELVVKMPYGLSSPDQIAKITGHEPDDLKNLLDRLSDKGLLIDVWTGEEYRYIVSPLIIGIFEFTMMRTRGQLNHKEWARLFVNYFEDEAFFKANFGKGQKVSPLRVLPYEESIEAGDYVEIMDYEKAGAVVADVKKAAIGICSCRHEKMHAGTKNCNIPLDTCTSFDAAADTMIRHGFAREVSRSELEENLARSREAKLVLCTDNSRQNISFICHCCDCCCNVLLGINRHGYTNMVVTSSYIARVDAETCELCESCLADCPVQAISHDETAGKMVVDKSACLGCGVCALDCPTESVKLVKRDQRVLHPADTFERIILQCLEQGTLQNLLFANPQSVGQAFMRGLVGGFLKLPPIKRSLMSDTLRSRFLSAMRHGT